MKRNRYIQKIDINIRNNFVNRNSDVIVNRESDVPFCDVNGDSGYCSWAEVMVMLLIMMWSDGDVIVNDDWYDYDVKWKWCCYSWCEKWWWCYDDVNDDCGRIMWSESVMLLFVMWMWS